jgi:UDP:flavonoid glycosyltransferase YjiC (YdhE family)
VFCYLKPGYPGLADFIQQIRGLSGYRFIIFCPGVAPSARREWSAPHIAVISEPVAFGRFDEPPDAAACHAGHGMVAAMLLQGVPLLLLPINLEQHLTARRVMDLGAGLAVGDTETEVDYASLLRRLLEKPGFQEAAARFADSHRDDVQEGLQARILERIICLSEAKVRD